MSEPAVVIGDLHGDLEKLDALLADRQLGGRRLIFLGDYVNRGSDSSGVLGRLAELRSQGDAPPTTFLRGNHDAALIQVLDGGPVAPLLAMGGASTILSYDPGVVGAVADRLREVFPVSHRAFLDSLVERWADGEHVASHAGDTSQESLTTGPIKIVGHYIQASMRPRWRGRVLYIDTGCGSLPNGRLTAVLLPELEWIQY